jgi:hypothetical protein
MLSMYNFRAYKKTNLAFILKSYHFFTHKKAEQLKLVEVLIIYICISMFISFSYIIIKQSVHLTNSPKTDLKQVESSNSFNWKCVDYLN